MLDISLTVFLNAELPEYHPVVHMLWEKSRKAAEKMTGKEDSTADTKEIDSETVNSDMGQELSAVDSVNGEIDSKSENEQDQAGCASINSWFQTASRLEQKAKSRKEKGDIDGAIEATKHVLEFRRVHLAKRRESKKPICNASQEVAKTLVGLAKLQLIREDVGEAEELLREAMVLYKLSGFSKRSDYVQEIKRELDRLKWQRRSRGGSRFCTRLIHI